ncbi:c-type cytochrome biogenesis protein CcmI [Magnetofaba australis]|uniref:Cytochrome c-type biogenesis protein H TPR domain-containing protein n=1 Tax=Magnetofaba australis IT-1 TaxID=1434232 RepID=A0A1Y2K2Z5_9PROT|nr:c-type cytochrome biogenesis protein CcmI [Magnetofaba australis]OSM02418.1 hypothetical protein MAIT1_02561 [Magnetofaba australis IT-1]
MAWLWFLPGVLATALLLTLWPLLRRNGNAPLPVGLEGNPRIELEERRDLLIRQIKELEVDVAAQALDAADAAEARAGLETELADALARLDAAPKQTAAPDKSNGSLSIADRAMAVSVATLTVAVSAGLYIMLGAPVDPDKVAAQTPAGMGSGMGQAGGFTPDIQKMVAGLAARMAEDPSDMQGWAMLIRSYQRMGMEEKARAALDGALKQLNEIAAELQKTPDDVEAWLAFADECQNFGLESRAIDAYTHILTRKPDNLEAALSLGALQALSDDAQQRQLGETLLKHLVESNPERYEAWWYLGVIASQAGDEDLAANRWNKLLELMPADHPNRDRVQQALDGLRQKP